MRSGGSRQSASEARSGAGGATAWLNAHSWCEGRSNGTLGHDTWVGSSRSRVLCVGGCHVSPWELGLASGGGGRAGARRARRGAMGDADGAMPMGVLTHAAREKAKHTRRSRAPHRRAPSPAPAAPLPSLSARVLHNQTPLRVTERRSDQGRSHIMSRPDPEIVHVRQTALRDGQASSIA